MRDPAAPLMRSSIEPKPIERAIMNTTTETTEERRARIQRDQLAAFEEGVRYHFANPPETWTVRKAAERNWRLVNAAGDMLMSFPRKRDADTALEMSLDRQSYAGRIWHERNEWYLGTSRDPRNRALTADEQAVIARVLMDTWEVSDVGCYWNRTLSGGQRVHIYSWTSPHLPSDPGYRSGYALIVGRELIGNEYSSFVEAVAAAETLEAQKAVSA